MSHRDTRIAIEDGVSFTNSNGEIVIFDERREQVYGLEGPAAEAFLLLQQGQTLGEATDAILAEYDVARSVVETDLQTIFRQLAEQGLLRLVDGSPRDVAT